MEIAQLSKGHIITSCSNPHNFARAKVKDHTMTMYTYTPTTVPSYILRFLRYGLHEILKVTMARSKSNQAHTMTLHAYTPTAMFLPSFSFLHLMASEI